MQHPSRPRPGRALLAAVAAATATWGLARLAGRSVAGAPDPDAVVGAVTLGVGATAAAVLTVGCALATVAGLAGTLGRTWAGVEALASRLLPAALRRLLAVGVGAGMTLGLGTAALADEADVGWQVTTPAAAATASGPGTAALEVPAAHAHTPAGPATEGPAATEEAAPATTAERLPAPPPTGRTDAPATVTVRPGDSLWAITAGLLGPGASDADVAAAWPRLYEANRDVLGPDPDLVHPGVVLTVPQEVLP